VSLGVIDSVDPAFYRMFFWGIGHGAQQVNLAAMVAVWYALIGLTLGGRTVSETMSRLAFLLLLAFIHLGAVHHLLVDPGLGTSHRLMNTSYLLYLAVLASLIHAFCIPAAIEVAQRERGFRASLFEWLKKAPWKEPGFSALVLSVVLFGFLAGVTGVLMSTMQMNMLIHNTLFVPGHFHSRWSPAPRSRSWASPTTWCRSSPDASWSVTVPRPHPALRLRDRSRDLLDRDAARRAARRTPPSRQPGLRGPLLPVDNFTQTPGRAVDGPRQHRSGDRHHRRDHVHLRHGRDPAVRAEGERAAPGHLAVAFGPQAVGQRGLPGRGHRRGRRPHRLGTEHEPHDRKIRFRNFEAPGTVILVFVFLGWFMLMYLLAHFNIARVWPVG
jgi:hypothetical protein